MIDYALLREICRKNSETANAVVDEFLLYYVAKQEQLQAEMDIRFSSFRHTLRKFPKGSENMLKAQYIAHRIFRKNGMIHKYLGHSALSHLNNMERDYLVQHAGRPWQFTFSVISGNPAEDFFFMWDVFRGDTFLMYSPGTRKTLDEQPVILWFNLIGFNGSCWQSYGPIGFYRSFEVDDIFFFGTEFHPQIDCDEDLVADVENNPVPYMQLLAGSTYPLIYHAKDQIVHNLATYDCNFIDTTKLANDFTIEQSGEVCRIGLKRWNGFPHYSTAYHNKNNCSILLSSMTDRGFQQLVGRLNSYGFRFSPDAETRVNQSMVITAGEILKRKIELNTYEQRFGTKTSEKEQEELDQTNNLLQMMLPAINAGQTPDFESIALQAGCDVETVRVLADQVIRTINKKRRV